MPVLGSNLSDETSWAVGAPPSMESRVPTYVRWLLVVAIPFVLAYCLYWSPVWLGSDDVSQYSAWAVLVSTGSGCVRKVLRAAKLISGSETPSIPGLLALRPFFDGTERPT